MADPLLFSLVQDLEFQTGYRIKQVVATRADIVDAIARRLSRQGVDAHTGGATQVPAMRPAAARSGAPPRPNALMRASDEEGYEPIAGLEVNAARRRRSSTSSTSS